MILLQTHELRKYYGQQAVLTDCTLEIRNSQKIGLVGPNGAGKSTLLRLLASELESDGGRVTGRPLLSVGYLQQHAQFTAGLTVQEAAYEALRPLVNMVDEFEQVSAAMGQAASDVETRRLATRFEWLQHELLTRDAFHLDRRIDRVLEGLRFTQGQRLQPVEQLSGGQQNRLLLAQLLLAEPDVMLLDEPSNHLDLEATQWLEEFLLASSQAFVVVSHDRFLLDRVTNHTWELVQGEVDCYRGNFSAYRLQKSQRLEVQRRTFDKQQEEITRLQDFVRRNLYGQKHAQAEDRRKKLERMDRVSPPREISAPAMFFPPAARSGDIVLRAEHMGKSFDHPLFHDLSFDVLRGQRWGILGRNGCGKTTLVRCLLGQEPLDQGRVTRGTGVLPGYLDQRLESVSSESLLVDAVRPARKEMDEPARRSLLARFGLPGDRVFQHVASLSGGERSRAALARLAADDANLLILDEPTNHLDLWARQALEEALLAFDGTVLIVSHDRYFLDSVVDHLVAFDQEGATVFPGSYSQYVAFRAGQGGPRTAPSAGDGGPPEESPRGAVRRSDTGPNRTKWRFPYRKVSEIEGEIQACEAEVEDIHRQLAMPQTHRDGTAVKAHQARLVALGDSLRRLYEHWEEALERN